MPAPHATIKSANVAADATAYTGKGFFYGLIISGAAGVVKVYDNTAASGTQIFEASGLGTYILTLPIPVNVGIHVDITGNVATVLYTEAP
jgi:hypothetical protein